MAKGNDKFWGEKMKQKKIKLFTFNSLLIIFFGLVLSAQALAAGVSLVAVPTTQTVNVGQTATYTIKINRDNFADKVTLSATGLPSGVTATLTPNPTTAASSTLKLQTLTTTPIGTFNINVKGTANGITIAPIVVQLITRPVPSISVSITPSTQFIVAGQSTFYDIAISRFNFDGKLTLSAQNLPNGVTAFFEPESTYGNSSRMYLYSNNLPFFSNNYSIAVRAFGNGIDKLTFVQLRVNYGINWAAQFGAPNNQSGNHEFATDVTYDSAGNVYLAGYLINVATSDFDSWVAKFDSAGNQLWLSMIPGLLEDKPTDVFADVAGNVYVAGSMRGQSLDIFIAKFDAGGTLTSPVSLFGTAYDEGQSGMQFGVGAMGNTILTAVTRVRIDNIVGQRDAQNVPATFGQFDLTRFTFDPNFNRTSSTIVVDGTGEPKDLAVGGDGSLYVLGEDHSQISPPPRFLIVTSQVEKFNPLNGQSIYRSQPVMPSNGNAFKANHLKVDASGNVFAVGTKFSREFVGVLVYSNAWLVKLDTSGARVWFTEPFVNLLQTEITALDIDASGNIICAGYTWDSLRGTNPNRGAPTAMNARTDAFLARYSRVTGTELSLSQFNVNDHDGFNAVKVGAAGNGFLNSTLYFAGYTLNFKNVNYFGYDAVLLRCSSFDCGYTP